MSDFIFVRNVGFHFLYQLSVYEMLGFWLLYELSWCPFTKLRYSISLHFSDWRMIEVFTNLFISDAASAQNEPLLIQNSIRAILTVMDYPLAVKFDHIDYFWIELLDIPQSDLLSHFDQSFSFIDTHLEKQQSGTFSVRNMCNFHLAFKSCNLIE